MCGITGVWWPTEQRRADALSVVGGMAEAIRHRGPDAEGMWVDEGAGIALGHRRLSVLELSPAGAQPMVSSSGRFVIVFNGEIYNHLTIRASLESEAKASGWRGGSDTETLLAAIEFWGLERCLSKAHGMFAFALWDRSERSLTLVRDRFGEKPLYYGRSGGALLFGSELKALKAFPAFDDTVDRSAVAAFLRYSYVPDPVTIYAGVKKLPPGCTIKFAFSGDDPQPQPFWSLEAVALEGTADRLEGDSDFLASRVDDCLFAVVKSQMLSDVPLGCFLSGGIDSSIIAALMQRAATQPVKTFSIGFADARFNEAPYARGVAEHLGTSHTEFIVSEAEALAVIPELSAINDEPFGDSSQIPTILLARLARQHVTVAMSGDGGDEVFGGYNRYTHAPQAWRLARMIPQPGRRLGAQAASSLQAYCMDEKSVLHAIAMRLGLPVTTIRRLAKLGEALGRARDIQSLYGELVSTFPDASIGWRLPDPSANLGLSQDLWRKLSPEEWMMAMDSITYLPGDILVKVDRAAMSASLETRAPFLDSRVAELAWRLPQHAKIDGRVGKKVLRDVLQRYVPRSMMDRPKQGFAIPIDGWLRGKLRDWAGDLLSRESIARHGFVAPEAVSKLWADHQSGRDNAGNKLWTVLMLQLWAEGQRV